MKAGELTLWYDQLMGCGLARGWRKSVFVLKMGYGHLYDISNLKINIAGWKRKMQKSAVAKRHPSFDNSMDFIVMFICLP